MPPKRKPSAPANRVYKSATPLQQCRFPLRNSRVKYGKQTAKKVPKQDTLTQMDFVNLHRPLDEEEEDLGNYEEPDKAKRKRRKTTGDVPSSESKYHTQTITQLDWSFTSEREEDDSIFDVPSSSIKSKDLRQKNNVPNAKPRKPAIQTSSRRQSAPSSSVVPGSMAPPQTPHRRVGLEIPSSESPATPPSRTSPIKGSILEERSINVPITFNTTPKPQPSTSKLLTLRIEDTFELENVSQQSRIPTTPSKRSSPAKTVRFTSPEVLEDVEGPPATNAEEGARSVAPRTPSTRRINDEILDSDAESDEDYEDQQQSGPSEVDQEEQEETCYGEIGLDTQTLLETQKRPVSPCIEESQILDEETQELVSDGPQLMASQILSETLPEVASDQDHHIMESQILGKEISQEALEERTQYMESQRLATQHVHAMAPRTKNSDAFVSIQPQKVTKIVDQTQDHDFRHQMIPDTVSRIWIYETSPAQTLKYMAVISAVKRPGEIVNEDGAGNKEFNAKAPNCGEFAWEILELYELADPLHWSTIASNEWLASPPRRPTLVRPAVLDQLMANLKPALFSRVLLELPASSFTDTQDAEEQLLNTMIQYTQQPTSTQTPSSLVIKEEDGDDEDGSGSEEDVEDDEDRERPEPRYHTYQSDSSEDDEEPPHSRPPRSCLRSTTPSNTIAIQIIKQESQKKGVRAHYTTPQEATQGSMAPPKEYGPPFSLPQLPRPSQAETVDLSQPSTPSRQRTVDIVFESPSRPIFSSTPMNLPTPRDRENVGPDSLLPYSMTSSQLLAKSQMLPESLLNDSVPGPPLFIQDSDEDDDI